MARSRDHQHQMHQEEVVAAAQATTSVAAEYSLNLARVEARRLPTPTHNSKLTGAAYIQDLLNSAHPHAMRDVLGVSPFIFRKLARTIERCTGITSSKHVTLYEKVAWLLYICKTGQGYRGVAKRFHRALSTISAYAARPGATCDALTRSYPRYFPKMVHQIVQSGLIVAYVRQPQTEDPLVDALHAYDRNLRYFRDALGAIDGTHVPHNCHPTEANRYRDSEGNLSMNVLVACDFDQRFVYMLSGAEGGAFDSQLWDWAMERTLRIPEGKYYLADAGFSSLRGCLTPYRDTNYHLADWLDSDPWVVVYLAGNER